MKRHIFTTFFLVTLCGLMLAPLGSAFAGPELVGAPKCKMCHKAKTGDQWKTWTESRHAGAFETLASEAALEIAADQGLGNPQEEPTCLACHTTAGFLGDDVAISAKGKYVAGEGVGCEACHGPGSDYKSKKVMEDAAAAKEAGLVMDKSEAACVRCHNENSPTFKGFEFEECWAEVAHPVPAGD